MKNVLLQRLLKRISDNEIISKYGYVFDNKIIVNNVLSLTNNEVEKILSNKTDISFLVELFFTIKHIDFLDNLKNSLKKSKNIGILKDAYAVFNDESLQDRSDLFELVDLIASGEEEYISDCLLIIITSSPVMEKDNVMDYLNVLANASGEDQAIYGAELLSDISLLERDDSLDLLKLIAYNETCDFNELGCAVDIATNEYVLEEEEIIPIVKLFLDSTSITVENIDELLAKMKMILKNDNSYEILKSITTGTSTNSSSLAISIIGKDLLKREEAVKILNAISHSKKEYFSRASCFLLFNPKFKDKDNISDYFDLLSSLPINEPVDDKCLSDLLSEITIKRVLLKLKKLDADMDINPKTKIKNK